MIVIAVVGRSKLSHSFVLVGVTSCKRDLRRLVALTDRQRRGLQRCREGRDSHCRDRCENRQQREAS